VIFAVARPELTNEVAHGWKSREIVDVVVSLDRKGQLLPLLPGDLENGGSRIGAR